MTSARAPARAVARRSVVARWGRCEAQLGRASSGAQAPQRCSDAQARPPRSWCVPGVRRDYSGAGARHRDYSAAQAQPPGCSHGRALDQPSADAQAQRQDW